MNCSVPSVVAFPGIELLVCDPVVATRSTRFIGSDTVDLSTLLRPGAIVLRARRDKLRCLAAKFRVNAAELDALIWDSEESYHSLYAFVVDKSVLGLITGKSIRRQLRGKCVNGEVHFRPKSEKYCFPFVDGMHHK